MSGLTKPCGSGGARAGVHTSQSLRLQSKWGLQFQVLPGCHFNLWSFFLLGFDALSGRLHLFRVVNSIFDFIFQFEIFFPPLPLPVAFSATPSWLEQQPETFSDFLSTENDLFKKVYHKKRQMNLLAARPLAELTLILPEKKRSE